ncbi:MAG: hypothetical protein LAO03_06825 [Acidobacteriia bacterium]|nr:hypothetical protein [Terriglobia bacterium]
MKPVSWLLLLAVLVGPAFSQSPPAPVYVESFRKGSTRIAEKTLQVNLGTKQPSYEARIQDSTGDVHFMLSLAPVRVGQEDPSILSWRVSLVDLHRKLYGNLLLPYRDAYLNTGLKGNVAMLDPSPYAVVPVRAKRVIKVEKFYCSIEVKQYHFEEPGKPHLDSMSVEVQFSNTNPPGN